MSFEVTLTVPSVLNLVISGIPSIPKKILNNYLYFLVLNLVISGIPSIQQDLEKVSTIFF